MVGRRCYQSFGFLELPIPKKEIRADVAKSQRPLIRPQTSLPGMTGRGGLVQFWKPWLCYSLLYRLNAHTVIACVPSEECNGGRTYRFPTWRNHSRDELLYSPCRRNRANWLMHFF